jgi:ferredoxin-nitrate reductase
LRRKRESFKSLFSVLWLLVRGQGAYGFVKSYRELNKDDQITIFSKENHPFYNRVMLPDYISGEQKWEQLVKMKDEEEPAFNINLLRG